jgi:Tfp pilus assembly protein PilO
VVLACFVLYLFLVKPQKTELANVRAEVVAEETKTAQLRVELARLKDLQAHAPELQAKLAEIRSFVPGKPDLANFIFQVQEAANRAGLDFVQITPELPKGPPEGAALAQVRATIGAAGGYFSLQDFLRRLYSLDRALRVDTVNMAVQSTAPFGTRLTLTIAARVFYEPPLAVVGATGTTTTPVASPTPSPTTTP